MIFEITIHHSYCDNVKTFPDALIQENYPLIDDVSFEGFNCDLTVVFYVTINTKEYGRRLLTNQPLIYIKGQPLDDAYFKKL